MYVFDIRRAVDENGKEIVPAVDMKLNESLISYVATDALVLEG
jgi:hypothetical protein